MSLRSFVLCIRSINFLHNYELEQSISRKNYHPSAHKMEALSVQQAASIQYMKTHLPILHQVLQEINPKFGTAWCYAFAEAGMTDSSFPADREAMNSTALRLGLLLSDIELDHFHNAQYQWFAKPVENGSTISYPDEKPAPYKTIYAKGFPTSGTFGQVEKVSTFANPSKVYARKRLLHVHKDHIKMIEKEIGLLQKFQHPHAIAFHGMYSHRNQVFLLFDFADGNLSQFLEKAPASFMNLPSTAKASKFLNWMIDIASAMAAFHAIGGVHRNLKPENILLKGDTILLADFGLTTQEEFPSKHSASIHGTGRYMASEQEQDRVYGRKSDIFAMGCVFLEMVVYARNISISYFENFRRTWGPQSCEHSLNTCYIHNLKAVALFIAKFLRRKDTIEPLIDLIELDMMEEQPTLRSAARDIRSCLLMMAGGFEFFKKETCCGGDAMSLATRDPSMGLLLGHMMDLSLTTDPEAMDIDMDGRVGLLDEAFF
jgi:hypothetical protein